MAEAAVVQENEGRTQQKDGDVMQTSLLFVCMGNICRSPMAVGVMRKLIADAGLHAHLRVDSAGTHDYRIGRAPDPRAQQVALSRGYDLSSLRARQITPEDFIEFDLLLAMDRNNLALLQSMSPFEHRKKVRLLMDFACRLTARVVPDPFDGEIQDFVIALNYIEDACEGIMRIVKENIEPPCPTSSHF